MELLVGGPPALKAKGGQQLLSKSSGHSVMVNPSEGPLCALLGCRAGEQGTPAGEAGTPEKARVSCLCLPFGRGHRCI